MFLHQMAWATKVDQTLFKVWKRFLWKWNWNEFSKGFNIVLHQFSHIFKIMTWNWFFKIGLEHWDWGWLVRFTLARNFKTKNYDRWQGRIADVQISLILHHGNLKTETNFLLWNFDTKKFDAKQKEKYEDSTCSRTL